jgi:hypothetical protein
LYAIMALVFGKRKRVEVPFCNYHHAWRRKWTVLGMSLLFGFVPVLMLLGALGVKSGVGAIVMIAMILAGATLLFRVRNSFRPVYIDEKCAKFKGACEPFMSILPGESPVMPRIL